MRSASLSELAKSVNLWGDANVAIRKEAGRRRASGGSGMDAMRSQESMSERSRSWRKGTCVAALGLKPRRQIRQPLRGGVNEHGLQVLVQTSEDESTDKNEKHAQRRLHRMTCR